MKTINHAIEVNCRIDLGEAKDLWREHNEDLRVDERVKWGELKDRIEDLDTFYYFLRNESVSDENIDGAEFIQWILDYFIS